MVSNAIAGGMTFEMTFITLFFVSLGLFRFG